MIHARHVIGRHSTQQRNILISSLRFGKGGSEGPHVIGREGTGLNVSGDGEDVTSRPSHVHPTDPTSMSGTTPEFSIGFPPPRPPPESPALL